MYGRFDRATVMKQVLGEEPTRKNRVIKEEDDLGWWFK